ncbi:hypothetical protein TH468_12370 [Thalassospira sp. MCCC 1A03138]|nr:hypothetical protein TH468_12370 [Thalassospira sp. MCCC 1A03138]
MHQHFSFTRPLGLSFAVGIALAVGFSGFGVVWAQNDAGAANIVYPEMDAQRGKKLFAERGCVVCHAVNNVGGDIGPGFDASNIDQSLNPFDFFARMWHGADEMLHLQRADLGYQIDFNGQDLADIYAFAHDREAQESFTEDDLSDRIREIIDNGPSVTFE